MKKLIALLLAMVMVLALAACTTDVPAPSSEPTDASDPTDASATVMTHAEFVAAPLDSEVIIETYVQNTESWWDDKTQVYAQSPDGGYYIYDLACTQDEAALLVPGTKLLVKGYKAEWSGEVEIIDATYEIIPDDTWIAEATDVTAAEDLTAHMNELVLFKGMTVAASTDANGKEAAYLYKWDGSGQQGDDLYFNVQLGETVYTFTVNVYMNGTGADSEVYKAVEALTIGDTIDVEGFLYWYNGAQTHVTAITPAA